MSNYTNRLTLESTKPFQEPNKTKQYAHHITFVHQEMLSTTTEDRT